ncbi:membrane protein [Acidocella aquatica]|uniref:Membrane protein n=1 Tax=Acidocella aquatica TaxID=1922313 RepID=A0ABQ6AFN6_9PROT|nr:OmpA family protein [Acidocella aquatica]GLR68924.1 membrane protein [Acidocella aquatica]
MKLRLILAAATCLALPIAAHAQPVTGPYVSLEGGTSFLNSTNYDNWAQQDFGQLPAVQGPTGKIIFRPSYAGAVSVGYGFGNGLRVELGGNLYRNTAVKVNENTTALPLGVAAVSPGSISGGATGGQYTYGPMLNVLYDMNLGLPIFPYVGVGVGYQWAKLQNHIYDSTFVDNYEGTRGSFAYQIIAGVSYPLPMVQGLSVTAEYRFMQLTASRNYVTTYPVPGGPYDGPVKFGQQSSHTFLIGLRYQLFNPAPAPAPAPAVAPVAAAPAPAPARTYLVFFDWDKASLTPRATQIIAQAASDSKTQATTTIDVNGYTDTSGTPVYNQGLSVRRAKAVAAQLVTDGVPASEITTKGFGDTNLLVPTGPGVREPQNRRVEIILN